MNEARRVSRRAVLRRLGAAGIVLPAAALAACADTDTPAATKRTATSASTPSDGHSAPQPTSAGGAAQAVQRDFLPNPPAAPPLPRRGPEEVRVDLEIIDIEARIAEGAAYRYWTFNGTVPGPMVRVRQDDTVVLSLANRLGNVAPHNIDLHAVTGPGGGSTLTNVAPGETKSFRFKALHPGVYIYHCATAPVAMHISNGMFGLIVVEPPDGLPAVDREFYVCQGELYTPSRVGDAGLLSSDFQRMLDELPSHVLFNGAVGALTGDRALRANTGERVRIWFGVGGPNLTSTFHVIGEVFDRAAIAGSLSSFVEDVQSVTVGPGSATMVEFDVQVPGTYLLVDHALSRADKGALGHLVVEGPEDPAIFGPA